MLSHVHRSIKYNFLCQLLQWRYKLLMNSKEYLYTHRISHSQLLNNRFFSFRENKSSYTQKISIVKMNLSQNNLICACEFLNAKMFMSPIPTFLFSLLACTDPLSIYCLPPVMCKARIYI